MTDIGVMNAWRLQSPGATGWARSARPGSDNKYLLVDTDSHANEPSDLYKGRIPEELSGRLPHIEVDETGDQWLIIEGWRPQRVKRLSSGNSEVARIYDNEELHTTGQVWSDRLEPDDVHRMEVSSTKSPDDPGLANRRRDLELDGIDVQIVFPGRGLLGFAAADASFSGMMCRAWNRWALEVFGEHSDCFLPMAMIAPGILEEAVAEVEWAAENGFRGFVLPTHPAFGSVQDPKNQYNNPKFDPLWAAISATGRPMMYHVATGRDPRASSGPGGAILNLVLGSLTQVIDPLSNMLAAGVMERFPDLRVGTVEGGIGWLPWLLDALDEAARKHHMWVYPELKEPPSSYYRRQCFSTFVEDPSGLALVEEYDLISNVTWSSDFPHQEGSWPHSAEAIERQMQHLDEEGRRKILGANAARIWNI